MKYGDRISYNYWTRKDMTRQEHEHRHEKKDSEVTDFPDSSVWL